MRVRIGFYWGLLIFAAVALPCCQQTINYPSPTIAAISPNQMQAGQPSFTLVVTGANFTPASTVGWNGLMLTPYVFVSASEIDATVPASFIATAGMAQVAVSTPEPGGGITKILFFTITQPATPVPHITQISPTSVLAGSSSFQINVLGSNFVSNSVINVNGINQTTAFQNSGYVLASVTASTVVNAGTLQVEVINPPGQTNPPGGGPSNQVQLSVTNPAPSLASISPASLAAASTPQALTVNGVAAAPIFATNSVVLINGAPHTTTFVSTTQVTAVLTASDLANAGELQVQVTTPGPGGGTSNMLPFAVTPTLTAGLPVIVDYATNGLQADAGICDGPTNCANGTFGLTLANSGPSVSGNGEYAAFASVSNNLLTNQANSSSDIFLRDTCLAATAICTPNTFDVSVGTSGVAANGPSFEPSMDSSGSLVAYTSKATNLVNYVSFSNPSLRQVYVQPACGGGTGPCTFASTNPAVLVSISADGSSPGNGDSYNPVISPDGQYVAFVSLATNLVTGVTVDGITPQVYLRNICNPPVTPETVSPSCTPTTYLVSSPDGVTEGNGASSSPVIACGAQSGGGCTVGTFFVGFVSTATNLGATAPNPGGLQEVFVQSECQLATAGCTPTMALGSTPDGTTPANGASSEPAASQDGRFIAFASTATNLGIVPGGFQQIYVRDTCTGVTTGCSPATRLVSSPDTTLAPTTPAKGLSEHPSVNGCDSAVTTTTTCVTGQFIAFASVASNLSGNVASGVENIFVRNTCEGITTACIPGTVLVSQAMGAPPAADGNSVAPAISGDGHTIAFISFADDLVAHDTNGLEDIFLAATSF